MIIQKLLITFLLLALPKVVLAEDPNLIREGPDRITVKVSACIANGGKISDEDYRYYTCAGGKYDGYITASEDDSSIAKVKTYCGWIDNPSPGNVFMQDSGQSDLVINVQGGHQAQGVDTFIPHAEEYTINGSYGTTCGCIQAVVEIKQVDESNGFYFSGRYVMNILNVKNKKLSECGQDKKIKSYFRPIKLVKTSGQSAKQCEVSEMPIEINQRAACVNEKNNYRYLSAKKSN